MVPVKFGRTSALAEEHVGVGEGGGRVRYIPRVGKSATLYLFPCVRGSAPLTFGSMCQWFGGSVDFFFVLLHFCYSLTHFFSFFTVRKVGGCGCITVWLVYWNQKCTFEINRGT